jgi:hypothetical protein
MYVLYYASMLQYWHLISILVRTDHPCLGVGCHIHESIHHQPNAHILRIPGEVRVKVI